MKKKLISIIVPCYNEEESIPLFYNEIKKVYKKMNAVDFEIIFVNDGSKDNTLPVLQEYAKKDKRIRYISFSKNFGKEAAMYAGLSNSTGDYVAIMDADLQDPPMMLVEMYDYVKEGEYDCAALFTSSHEGYSFIRKFLTNCWYKFIDKISNNKQVPGARDFRLMTRQMVDSILSMKEYNRYTKGMFNYIGFETKWIEYQAPDRVAGETKFNLIKLFKYAIEGVVSFSTSPLLIAAYVGLFLFLASIIALIALIIRALVWKITITTWAYLTCLIILSGSIQLIFLGIIGIYLSKIYLEVKNRPVYITKETEKEVK